MLKELVLCLLYLLGSLSVISNSFATAAVKDLSGDENQPGYAIQADIIVASMQYRTSARPNSMNTAPKPMASLTEAGKPLGIGVGADGSGSGN